MRRLVRVKESSGCPCQLPWTRGMLLHIHHVDLALKYASRVIGIRAGEIVYDGPTTNVTQEILDSIYNGAAVPQAGE